MSDVKRISERLDCMLFRASFKEEVDELKPVCYIACVYVFMYDSTRTFIIPNVHIFFYRWLLQSHRLVEKLKIVKSLGKFWRFV